MKTYQNLSSHFGSAYKKTKSPTDAQCQEMPDRCFLIPGKKKYSICNVGTQQVSCDALKAAYRRANLVLLDPRPHEGRNDAAIARAFAEQYSKKLGCDNKSKRKSKFG